MNIFLRIIIAFYLFTQFLYCDTLIMGYRESERPPLIGNKNNNDGLYKELYTIAAKKLGYELKIVRKPKRRILFEMKQGLIDFYPGFTFTDYRTDLVYFIENGLPGGDIGISLDNFPEINSFEDLSEKRVLVAAGGPSEDLLRGIESIRIHRVPKLTIKKAISIIKFKRDDFYIYNKASVEYFIKKNKIEGIKIHENCCGGIKPMYLGFSRSSPNYSEKINLFYDIRKPISINNMPTTIDKNSIAYKFLKVLEEMKKDGTTLKLYNKYYK